MAKKLFITNERMLQLMDWAIQNGVADSELEYFEKIGFTRTNITNIRKGIGSFTKQHILNACSLTGASADYIFGFSNSMLRKPGRSSIEMLKEAVMAAEHDLKKVSR